MNCTCTAHTAGGASSLSSAGDENGGILFSRCNQSRFLLNLHVIPLEKLNQSITKCDAFIEEITHENHFYLYHKQGE